MPKRYLMGKKPIAKVYDDFDPEGLPDGLDSLSRIVFELEPAIMPTGVLDQYGDPILYTDEMDQIGFTRF